MTEYKSFDDYVKNTFNIEPRELTHISPEEQKKKTVVITVDELINIWKDFCKYKHKVLGKKVSVSSIGTTSDAFPCYEVYSCDKCDCFKM